MKVSFSAKKFLKCVLNQVTKVLPQNTEQGSAGKIYAQAYDAKERLLGFRNFWSDCNSQNSYS